MRRDNEIMKTFARICFYFVFFVVLDVERRQGELEMTYEPPNRIHLPTVSATALHKCLWENGPGIV
jgi:hypothetical protein